MARISRGEWKILVSTDGKLDEEKVMKELDGFAFMIEQVPLVYNHVTGGRMSKSNYFAHHVIQEHDELCLDKGITQDDVRGLVRQAQTLDYLKDELREYFDLGNMEVEDDK